MDEQQISFRETLRYLNISHVTLLRWIGSGELKAAKKVVGGIEQWRIPAVEVERIRQERVASLQRQLEKISKPVLVP